MTASNDTEASHKEADDDSIAYKPDYTDSERVDVGAATQVKSVGEVGLTVDAWPNEGEEGTVTMQTRDGMINCRLFCSPDRAEWLANQLLDHADAARADD